MIDQLISALIGGAAIAAKGVASDAVKTAYDQLKVYLSRKFNQVDVSSLENFPDSEEYRSALAQDLRDMNVDKDGELKALVIELLGVLRSDAGGCADVGYVTQEEESLQTNTLLIFLDITSKKKLIGKFPIGPSVDIHTIPVDDIAIDLSASRNSTRALAIVQNANRLRRMVDPDWPEEAVCVTETSNPDVVGHHAYWFGAIDEARVKGPRMLAALLLSLPLNTWLKFGEETFRTLEKGNG